MVVSNFQHFKKVSFSSALFFHFNFISPNESSQHHCFKMLFSSFKRSSIKGRTALYNGAQKGTQSLCQRCPSWSLYPSTESVGKRWKMPHKLTGPSGHTARCCPNLGPGDIYTAIQLFPHSHSGVSYLRESCR